MKDIPDLQFTAGKLEMISKFQEHSENSQDDADEVVESIETTVCYQNSSDVPLATLHEHSQNSLKGAVGVALERSSLDKTVQPDRGEQQHDIFCESGEESQNSRVDQKLGVSSA